MTVRPLVGLLGGTFDPIHRGHLEVARASQRALALESVRFIPSARPPHRPDSPHASEYHRVQMLRRAVAEATAATDTRWEVSDLELHRQGPSYTFDTLADLHREGLTALQICFITGADAFAEIATWHRYPDVLDSAHFVVISRPGTTLAELQQRLPALASRMTYAHDAASATTTQIVLVNAATPDISSTEIRRAAARGEPLDPFVTPAVAAYIEQHSLYRH